MRSWSLIIDREPLPGSWNMAVDERLFTLVSAPGHPPRTFLRFYRWARPTASLGYSQDLDKVIDVASCRAHGVDIVRRITGGKLVLHDREVTYAVASSDAELFPPTVQESYRLVSRALIKGLERLGMRARLAAAAPPPEYSRGTMPCFAFPARDEIEVGGRKLVGSAQKRTGPAFLQHGSIPLETDDHRLAALAPSGPQPETGPGMTSLSEALGRPVSFDEAVQALIGGFVEVFAIALEPFALGPEDRRAVQELEARRYASEDWTFRRQDRSR